MMGSNKKSDIKPHRMAAHVHLKEDEKYYNLVASHFVPRSFRTYFGHFVPTFWSFRTQ